MFHCKIHRRYRRSVSDFPGNLCVVFIAAVCNFIWLNAFQHLMQSQVSSVNTVLAIYMYGICFCDRMMLSYTVREVSICYIVIFLNKFVKKIEPLC